MKIQKFFLIGFMISSLICSGGKQVVLQKETKEVNYIPYYLKVYEADSLYLTGNYGRTFEILDSLFKIYEPLNQLAIYEMQTYIKTAFLTDNYEVMKPTFKTLIDTWGYKVSSLEYDSILMNAWEKTVIEDEEVALWIENYDKKINWTLRDTLIAMDKADQLYRGKDRGKVLKREDSIDLVNIDLLKYIFKKYGYPNFKIVGNPKYREMVDLSAIFNHISDNLNEQDYQFFQKELIKFLKQGESTQSQIAMMVDKREFDNNQKTVFGTFGTHKSFGAKMIKFDTLEVNRNRKSIGLPSIQYQQFKEEIFNSMFNN